jgi:type VI secretion system secreted protein VgrG
MADEIVLISKHGAFIRIADGITFGSDSPLKFNAPSFTFGDAQTMETQLPGFADARADQQFQFEYEDDDGQQEPQLAPQSPFEVQLGDGSTAAGRSDAAGQSELIERDAMHLAGIEVFNNKD